MAAVEGLQLRAGKTIIAANVMVHARDHPTYFDGWEKYVVAGSPALVHGLRSLVECMADRGSTDNIVSQLWLRTQYLRNNRGAF